MRRRIVRIHLELIGVGVDHLARIKGILLTFTGPALRLRDFIKSLTLPFQETGVVAVGGIGGGAAEVVVRLNKLSTDSFTTGLEVVLIEVVL